MNGEHKQISWQHAAAYFQVPVYVALKRRPEVYGQYYWAQFKVPSDIIYNHSRNNIFLDFSHFELSHITE